MQLKMPRMADAVQAGSSLVGQKAQEPGAHDARLPVQPSAVVSLSFAKEG